MLRAPRRPSLTFDSEPSAAAYLRELKLRAGLAAAAGHRRRLRHVSFVGITGSCGKTTTKELVAAILGSQLRGRKTPLGHNSIDVVAKTMLRTTSADAFCVLEVGAGRRPGNVGRAARLIRPNIAVVTTIGADHRTTFRTLEATAQEKHALVAALCEGGTAVLNADDPRVFAMRESARGRVISFGQSAAATMRAESVESCWPDRLCFRVLYEGEAVAVRTRLCGRHWVTSALAALAVAVAMQVPLAVAAAALEGVEPPPRRMSPAVRGGVTFIEDHEKSPFWALGTAFEFMAEARASRKIIVIGTISDYAGSASTKYALAARRALAAADEVVVAGQFAGSALKARPRSGPKVLRVFPDMSQAAEYLGATLRDGDLVLLKGSVRADGMARIVSGTNQAPGLAS